MSDVLPELEEIRSRFAADLAEAEGALRSSSARGLMPADVQELHVRWLGKKQGVVTGLLARLKDVPKE